MNASPATRRLIALFLLLAPVHCDWARHLSEVRHVLSSSSLGPAALTGHTPALAAQLGGGLSDTSNSAPSPSASLLSASSTGSYLVLFKPAATSEDLNAFCTGIQQQQNTSGCAHKYYKVFLGCAATLTPTQLREAQLNSRVANVTLDRNVTTSANIQIQQGAPWNLDRLDQASLPLDGLYHYSLDGSNVNVYVLDTGVRRDHEEFQYSAADQANGLKGSRVISGYSVYGDSNTDDCYGHGTHVSGIVGGLNYGVAKNATIYAVRCISCTGSGKASEVIAGVEWVAANVQLPAVVSMSLGADSADDVMDAAVQAVIDLGATVVTAAGNFNNDACQLSPGRSKNVINVGASDATDTRWPYSNYGSCVSMYAPGVTIKSSMYYSSTATIVASGTSMACPHVSGVAALYMQANPSAQPEEVKAFMLGNAVNGTISGALTSVGTPDLLLQTDLSRQATVTIVPEVLAPVILFEGSFTAASTQTITLTNTDTNSSSLVGFQTSVTSGGVLGGWVSTSPANGTVASGKSQAVTVKYDVSQNEFQGIFAADILITTNAQPLAKVLQATAYVFCAQLESIVATAAHALSINYTVVQDSRPVTSDWPAAPTTSPAVYVTAVVQFSHPLTALNTSVLSVNNGNGKIEGVTGTGPNGKLCSTFQVRASVPFSPWDTSSTTACLTIAGSQILDVYGSAFPAKQACTTLDHRPVGQMYAPYMVYSGGQGAITSQQNVVLLIVFSEPVQGLTTADFKVSGPSDSTVVGLKLLRGTASYYHFVVQLPATFYDQVTVSFTGSVMDSGSNANAPISPLLFSRVQQPIVEASAYQIIKPPALSTQP